MIIENWQNIVAIVLVVVVRLRIVVPSVVGIVLRYAASLTYS